MTITNHILDYAIQRPSPNHGGEITPQFITMHYTAGRSAMGAVATLTRRGSGVSAHVTVDQDGVVYQHVPFNIKAWHAGPSEYQGYIGLNNYAIGIEMVNLGVLRKVSGGMFKDYAGRTYSSETIGPVMEQRNPRVGSGRHFWPLYTDAQLEAVEELTASLIENYNIRDIVSHEEIDTRGWKTDPGPAFPMLRYKTLLKGDRDADSTAYQVTASVLNVRGGPGTEYDIQGVKKRGDIVYLISRKGDWVQISNGRNWVHGGYLRLV